MAKEMLLRGLAGQTIRPTRNLGPRRTGALETFDPIKNTLGSKDRQEVRISGSRSRSAASVRPGTVLRASSIPTVRETTGDGRTVVVPSLPMRQFLPTERATVPLPTE